MLIPETVVLTYDKRVLDEAGELGNYLYDLLHDLDKMYRDIATNFRDLEDRVEALEP